MPASPLAVRLILLWGAFLLPLAGCAEPGLRVQDPGVGAPPKTGAPSSRPSPRAQPDFSALRESIQGLRRGLANQEERIEETRKAMEALTDRLEKSQRSFETALKKVGEQLEGLRGRIDSVENEVAFLRAGAVRPGGPPEERAAAGSAGTPSQAAPVGVPQPGSAARPGALAAGVPRTGGAPPVGLPGEGQPAAVASLPPAGAPSSAGAPPPVKTPDPEAEYNEALRVLREEQSLPRARFLLNRFIDKYPTHELADDAQFWIGQSYYKEKNFERAILAFNKVQVDYANGDKAPDALLKEALSFLNLGDRASARELLGRVVRKYPGSEAAKIALERLKSL